MTDTVDAAAFGGPGWSPRLAPLQQEIGFLWGACGVSSEWTRLISVLLHRPGAELAASADPDHWQMLQALDVARAQEQHDALATIYRSEGVTVHYVEPKGVPPPNLLFVADLMFATPEGALVGRPASTVRAGEERFIAQRLAALGIPILRTVRGIGTFEGADAAWLDARTILLATGLRTNAEGAAQVTRLLAEMQVQALPVGLSFGTMHLMGVLRLADRDLAIAWPGRTPFAAVEALRARGIRVAFLPAASPEDWRVALNFVTLGPRRILMAAGHPVAQEFFEANGIDCLTVAVDELAKAAGGIGCLTGILERERE